VLAEDASMAIEAEVEDKSVLRKLESPVLRREAGALSKIPTLLHDL